VRVVVDENAGVDQVLGIENVLDFPHGVIDLLAPFPAYKRCHVAASAVLGFQGTVVFVHHQRHDVFHEGLVTLYLIRICEIETQNEVDVAVKHMAPNNGLLIRVLFEQLLQVDQTVPQVSDGNRDVFNDNGSPLGAADTGGRKKPLADIPQGMGLHRVRGEFKLVGQRKIVKPYFDIIDLLLQRSSIAGAGLD